MLLVLLPSFSSFFHIPSTCFTLCTRASFPSCWTNSAYLHTLKLPFLKAFFLLLASPYLLNYFQPFFLVFCGVSQVRDQPAWDGLAQDGLPSQLCGTTGQVVPAGALAMLLVVPAVSWPALQAGFGSGAPAAHTGFFCTWAGKEPFCSIQAGAGMLWGMMLWTTPALQTQELSLRLQFQDLFFQSLPCFSSGLIFSSQTCSAPHILSHKKAQALAASLSCKASVISWPAGTGSILPWPLGEGLVCPRVWHTFHTWGGFQKLLML